MHRFENVFLCEQVKTEAFENNDEKRPHTLHFGRLGRFEAWTICENASKNMLFEWKSIGVDSKKKGKVTVGENMFLQFGWDQNGHF